MKKTKVAFVYDFDETLSTTYMQDYFLIPELGMKPNDFWREANTWSEKNGVDQITGSMYYFKHKAEETGLRLTKENLKCCGEFIIFFKGVEEWFTRINNYGKMLDLDIVDEFDTMVEAEDFCENSDYWMWIDSDLVNESQYGLVGDDYDLHVFNAKEYETIH